jgi:dTDP-4-amino-4,6-dideoxygalactose transaminase
MQPARHQLPVYSPISLAALARGGGRAGAGREALAPLEAALASAYDARRVALAQSGTAALQLAIETAIRHRALPRQVALPAFCCYDVATAAVGADCRIALYDVDPVTLQPDLPSLARVLGAGAAVAVAVELYGVPLDWGPLRALADAHGAVLIEDAAQGHGGRWRDRPLGSLGEISVLSFGRGKGWTGGAGGAILLREAFARATLPSLAPADPAAGRRVGLRYLAQWIVGRPAVYRIPRSIPALGLGETLYHEPAPPAEMSAFSATVALATLGSAEREAGFRRANAHIYEQALRGLTPFGGVPAPSGSEAGYLRYPVRVPDARAVVSPVSNQRLGIAPSYPTTLADLPAVSARRIQAQEPLPGAERLVRELITLPTHSRLTVRERARIVEVVRGSGGGGS